MRNPQPASATAIKLPDRAHIDHLKNEAKSLLKEMRRGDPATQLATAH